MFKWVFVGLGALLAALFFIVPVVELPFLGSFTSWQLATLARELSVWFDAILLYATLVVFIAMPIVGFIAKDAKQMLGLAGLGVLGAINIFIDASGAGMSFVSFGTWLILAVALGAAAVAFLIQKEAANKVNKQD
ncbi:MAG: hypothetical protein FWC69_04215 [Defluviitaleaceae bacterium]|nr:hypothetical protein [Defluviitaleaceae bacterium]